MQRLFSTFPGGKPGVGLLLLRTLAGSSVIGVGILYLSSALSISLSLWAVGILLLLAGIGLAIGFLTPIVSLLAGIYFLGIAASWVSIPSSGLHDVRLLSFGLAITTAAIVLLGPGAFSLDGYLFGRREIVIPSSSPDSREEQKSGVDY